MNNETRNLILAVLLSVAILAGFNYFFDTSSQKTPPSSTQQSTSVPSTQEDYRPKIQEASNTDTKRLSREESLNQSARIPIETPSLKGSIALKGARLDDLSLAKYHSTTSPQSPNIVLLSPESTENPYYAEFGWIAANESLQLPSKDTVWTAKGIKLTPDSPLLLTWTSPQGVTFERTISIDEEYMFTITDRLVNNKGESLTLYPYGLISRGGQTPTASTYVLYEGPLGVLNGSLNEISYEDVRTKKSQELSSIGGWLGITDKYWLTALVPDQNSAIKAHFKEAGTSPSSIYQTDYLGPAYVLESQGTLTTTNHFFAGAKVVSLLDAYENTLNAPKLDRAVDFGWFYLITKPLFYVLSYINSGIGNFGISILLLTVLVKLLFFPLANKSYKAMARMKNLQPEIKKLQERYGQDKIKMNQELMAFYKKHKVNPMAGCLPLVIQIPVFFALYKVLYISIEMRHAPFFGWIQDLSAPDPTTLFNLFGLIPWDPPSFLQIGAWPLIMGATMVLQQRLSPQPADPAQAKVMMLMPIMFTYLLAQFPVGLVIYWTWSNILTILQQGYIMRHERKTAEFKKI